jgi:cytochrome c oxidase cbb3-type subunit III
VTGPRLAWVVFAVMLAAGAACEREARPFRTPRTASAADASPYQENAWGIAEGKRLYENFNCVGCHAHGGGGMGPALMDAAWIYGSEPPRIFQTIVDGRPNGMPSFRDRIVEPQVWQLVAYVRSLSGQAPMAALPGRSDHLSPGAAENQRPAETPVRTGTP